MHLEEIMPVCTGLLLGACLALLRPSLRWRVGMFLTVALGTLVTLITGEAQISWSFVLIDIPLTAVGAAVGLMGAPVLRRAFQRQNTLLP